MIYFVGDKPSSKNISDRAFHGASCEKRLLSWIVDMGVHANDYRVFNKDHIGVYSHGGINFDDGVTYAELLDDDKIVAVGREASKELFHLGLSHFVLPHPSGLNRMINDKEFIDGTLKKCKQFINS